MAGLLGLVLLTGTSLASADSLAEGITDYDFGDWKKCIEHLRAVLYPPILLESEGKRAREYLAACYFNRWVSEKMTNPADRESAEREAKSLLFKNEEHKISAGVDAGFRKFFEEVRAKYIDDLRAEDEKDRKRRLEEERILRDKIRSEFEILYASKEPIVIKIVRERDHEFKVAHAIPFYGQIYNKDYAAAVTFAAADVLLTTTSLYTFVGLKSFLRNPCSTMGVSRWRCPDPTFANPALARAFRFINVVSTTGAAVVLAGAIFHAAIRGRALPESLREMTTAEKIRYGIWKPKGDFAPDTPGTAGDAPADSKKDSGKPPEPRLYLTPFESPAEAGASLGLSLELRF